ncbi:MAG: site-specific integrase [Carnobacterium sp.]|nr:site-specific integrase [Carnobacterium sp.]
MASIIKRGNSFRAQISVFNNGKQHRISKTFLNKKDAKLWALKQEVQKGSGKDLVNQQTTFADYYDTWIHVVKRNDVREATFNNYLAVSKVVRNLFSDIKLANLNDLVIQRRIDDYAESHARKTVHEVVLKIRSCVRDAYSRGLLSNDFSSLIKTRGKEAPKKNISLSITNMKKLRTYVLNNAEEEFNIMVLVSLETGMRRGEILGIRPESIYEYGIKVRESISPTSNDTSLKTEKAKRTISINKEVYGILNQMKVYSNGYLFDPKGFKQADQLKTLLKKLDIPTTTFHGLRDTHASFLFSQEIDIAYISQRLGHTSIQTTQNYYLSLMPEKKHQQDADALNLLKSLSN